MKTNKIAAALFTIALIIMGGLLIFLFANCSSESKEATGSKDGQASSSDGNTKANTDAVGENMTTNPGDPGSTQKSECKESKDCESKSTGTQCVGKDPAKHCGCTLNEHCTGESKCIKHNPKTDTKVCVVPCAKNQDCSRETAGARDGGPSQKSDPSGLKCNPTTKLCVECLTNADCTSLSAQKCESTQGKCVECLTQSDCVGDSVVSGSKCILEDFRCGCENNSDCTKALGGKICLGTDARKMCGCSKPVDCPEGKTCQIKEGASGSCVNL